MSKIEHNHLETIRHSLAHVLSMAMMELYDNVKLGIGPAIEYGFYYDFGLTFTIKDENLIPIEEKMRDIISRIKSISYKELSFEEANELFKHQPYKLELINDLKENKQADNVTVYWFDNHFDLCNGPHVNNVDELKKVHFKLTSVSGAYWKGDSDRPMLQRIYGVAFQSDKELTDHLVKIEEAKNRDHRVLGDKLDLFGFSNEVGLGLPLWHPKGAMVRFLLEKFSQQAHIMNGYSWVYTPHIGRSDLWKTSGHLSFYKDSMYNAINIDDEEYYLKPMSCPFHILIYNDSLKSYKDLPLRYTEYATVYRYELSGTLQGLTRVRGFTQDDAHIICTGEQVESEVARALKFSLYILRSFGLNKFKAYVATKPKKKFIGEDADWNMAIDLLKKVVIAEGLEYDIDEGGGAFYGPKIDIKLYDSLGREWQCSTIQFDFNLPERFNMKYIGPDGLKHTPYMVHRALFGSIERFVAMLIEHYNGIFPLWLSPIQVGIVPINAEKHTEYARKIESTLRKQGLRVQVDNSSEKMNNKIRKFQLEKIPYIFVIGDNECENKTVSIRERQKGNIGTYTLEQFLEKIKPEIEMGIPQYLD